MPGSNEVLKKKMPKQKHNDGCISKEHRSQMSELPKANVEQFEQ